MSKNTLTLLKRIGFLDKRNTPVDLNRRDDEWIHSCLSSYYSERSRTADVDMNKMPAPTGLSLNALISSVSATNTVTSLLPSLLLYDHLITDDPLFREATPEPDHTIAQKQALGVTPRRFIDREWTTNKLQYFSRLAPLIEAGLLDVLPLSLLHLPPNELPLFYAEDRFRSEVPEGIHDFVHSQARIREAKLHKESGAFLILDSPNLERKRAIHVSFKGEDSMNGGMLFLFQTITPQEVDEESNRIRVSFECDIDASLREEVYQGWVYQSINRTILARLRAVASEFALAQSLGHTYLTESEFESQLLGASATPTHSKALCGAVNFLRANETMIAIEDASTILKLRDRNQHVFERFRASLLAISGKLVGVSPDEFEQKAKDAFLTDVQPQIDEVRRLAALVVAATAKGTLVSLGGVTLALATGSAIPFISAALYAAAGALTEALPPVSEFMQKRKTPEYIWSQISR